MSLCFRFKVSGELPLLHFKISDQKIQNVLELVDSIPLPNMGSSPSTPTEKVHLVQSSLTVATSTETDSDQRFKLSRFIFKFKFQSISEPQGRVYRSDREQWWWEN